MIYLIKNVDEDFENRTVNTHDFDGLKKLRLWDKRLDEILREMGIFIVFLIIIFVISFTNVSFSSFSYNQLFISNFVVAETDSQIGLYDVIIYIVIFKLAYYILMQKLQTFIVFFAQKFLKSY